MEFESSSRAQLSHGSDMERRKQGAGLPHNWPVGGGAGMSISNQQSDQFAIDSDGGPYSQNYGRMANTTNGFQQNENGNVQYIWPEGFEANGNLGLGLNISEQKSNESASTSLGPYSTMTATSYGDLTTQDTFGGLTAMSDLSVGFGTNGIDNGNFEDPQLWQQPQNYTNTANNANGLYDGRVGSPESDLLTQLNPSYLPMTSSAEFVLPIHDTQNHSTLLDSSEFPSDNVYSQPWQGSDIPNMGFGSLPTTPLMNGNLFPTPDFSNAHQSSSCTPNLPTIPSFHDDDVAEITDGLFTSEEVGLYKDAPLFGLSTVPDGYPLSHGSHSRDVSVSGNWDSPRTPFNWDGHASPCPAHFQGHGHNVSISGSQIEEILGNGLLEVMPATKQGAALGPIAPPLDEFTGNFDVNPKRQTSKRKRKAFSTEEKQKVNQVRESGACVSCHARKVPV